MFLSQDRFGLIMGIMAWLDEVWNKLGPTRLEPTARNRNPPSLFYIIVQCVIITLNGPGRFARVFTYFNVSFYAYCVLGQVK